MINAILDFLMGIEIVLERDRQMWWVVPVSSESGSPHSLEGGRESADGETDILHARNSDGPDPA
jgi:hypothetical protein